MPHCLDATFHAEVVAAEFILEAGIAALSEELRTSASNVSEPQVIAPAGRQELIDGALPAYIEWQRIQSDAPPERIFLPAAWQATRDLSGSLDNIGDVERAQGGLVQAEAAYRESLEVCRQQVERLGEQAINPHLQDG